MTNAMTNAAGNVPATASSNKSVLKSMLNADSVKEQFTRALGKHADAFAASILDLYTSDTQLQKCAPADVIAQAGKAATLGLPINKALGFAYIVVYNNTIKMPDGTQRKVPTPTFIPGYKGYIQLAKRSGQYRTINAGSVYEGELQVCDRLTGEINLNGQRKSNKVVGYFAYIEELNGFKKSYFMSVEDMAVYAKKYAPNIRRETTVEQLIALANAPVTSSKKVGWEGDFNAMAVKTCLRQLLSKYGSLTVEMESALAADMNAEAPSLSNGITQYEEVDADSVEYEEVPAGAIPTSAPTPNTEAAPSKEEKGKEPVQSSINMDEEPGY